MDFFKNSDIFHSSLKKVIYPELHKYSANIYAKTRMKYIVPICYTKIYTVFVRVYFQVFGINYEGTSEEF